ncbi:M23 family metallopeptidase [Methylobacterium oryzisoli]|uniref:M23 family metallopeptidase n=1 Tax=Methylobacterium oryzisoli TaxID=3385502 RepID=UPI003892476D
MTRLRSALLLTLLLALSWCPAAALAEPFRLRLPLACEPGRTCFVQHYVDHDPSAGARDHTCGSRTYDGHDGTDFRLATRALAAREPGTVLAAAGGRVLRTRNDAEDRSLREVGRAAVAGRECGNGLVIAHPDGYETQYCHLAKGSVRVRPGETVTAGQPIAQVGFSGATEFPHLHLTLRRHGTVVDPFAPGLAADGCRPEAATAETVWEEPVRAALAYQAGAVLTAGFADGPVTQDAVESEATRRPGRDAAALVAFVHAIGLDTGDVQRLTVTGPDGRVLAENQAAPLLRPRAESLLFAGRRRPPDGWASGPYTATFRVMRAGAVAIERVFTAALP